MLNELPIGTSARGVFRHARLRRLDELMADQSSKHLCNLLVNLFPINVDDSNEYLLP